jgi:heme-degrading monooxygenase HmoA
MMVVVIFEVVPGEGKAGDYLAHAAALRDELMQMDGFISVERFQSLTQSDKLLSLSFWRDEAAVKSWRNRDAHRAAQHAGRTEVFDDYRIRVAQVVRDYGMHARAEVPDDSKARHDANPT